jgi:hypothetical protein
MDVRTAARPGLMFYHFHGVKTARLHKLCAKRLQVPGCTTSLTADVPPDFERQRFLKGYGPEPFCSRSPFDEAGLALFDGGTRRIASG